jgi:hypothetical protein
VKERVRDLIKQSDKLFSKRASLMSAWQEQAENFYPERADFTVSRSLGQDFASDLYSSYPIVARRDLANAFSSMLRPRQRPWFKMRVVGDALEDNTEALSWLEMQTEVIRRAMYDPHAQFVRATKEGDHDFATFGQCVITPEWRPTMDGLIYRCWHLRDVVWCENAQLAIDYTCRKWKVEAREYMKLFPKTGADQVRRIIDKEPYREINCRHIVIPSEDYDYVDKERKPRRDWPFVSLYVDEENEVVLNETGRPSLGYVIPRWQTVSGSQYAVSPAVVAALPDARLLQAITLTVLEAGQKAVDPPMVATSEVVRSDINIYPGGTTWVDAEYDERLGEALRPLNMDHRALQYGVGMVADVRTMLSQAFYLNKITLPPVGGGGMTAYEVQQRMEEYVRTALPLFEPMEVEYNSALCEETLRMLMRANAFGPPESMPEPLRGQEVEFEFDSPLNQANERSKSQAFVQASELLLRAAQVDPQSAKVLDISTAFRDALRGIEAPADWIRPPEQVQEMMEAEAQAQQGAQVAQEMMTGATVAEQMGKAGQALQEVGV